MSHLSSPTLDATAPTSKAASLHEPTSLSPALEKKQDHHAPDHAHPLAQLGQGRKNFLLFVFGIATFLDICNVSGVGLAVAQISGDLDLAINQIAWVSLDASDRA